MSDRRVTRSSQMTFERAQSDLTAQLWSRLQLCQQKAKDTKESNKHCIEANALSGRKRAPNCLLKASGTAIHDFTKLGYQDYLSRAKIKDVTKAASIRMFAQFITYIKDNYHQYVKNIKDTAKILLWVIDSRRNAFGKYVDSLNTSCVNIKQRIDAIISAVSFLYDRDSGVQNHSFMDALCVLKNSRNQQKKGQRLDKRSNRGREHDIEIYAYPRDGLRQIQDNLHDGWDYFDALVAMAQAGHQLSESQYTECLRYVLATLWGYDNNARSLAIEKLCLDDVQVNLTSHDFFLSQNFKTYGHYTHQVVKFSLIISEIWIPIIRAQAISRCESNRVFLKYNGMPLQPNDCTRHVQEWFKRYGLVITVKTLRSILEESYKDAAATGVITERARTSLTLSQGHSERTAKQFYLPGPEAADAIIKAVEDVDAFDAICSSFDSYSPDDIPLDIESRVRNVKARTDTHSGLLDMSACFGVAYSGKTNSAHGQRFVWTEGELGWINEWFVKAYAEMPPGSRNIPNRYAACLHDLHQASPEVKAMFHPHHVANSDRFKNGAQKVERMIGALENKK
jgi:hypothetical protein